MLRATVVALFSLTLLPVPFAPPSSGVRITSASSASVAPMRAVGITTTSSGRNNGVTSLTISHASDGNPLFVFVFNAFHVVTGVTFDGSALKSGGYYYVDNQNRFSVWYDMAPATTTANVVISITSAEGITAGVYNIQDASYIYRVAYATGTSTSPSVAIESASGQLVVDSVTQFGANQTFAAGGGQTKLYGQDSVASLVMKTAGSYEAGASSVTMSWTLASSGLWGIGAVAIAPAAGGGGGGGERSYVFCCEEPRLHR